MFILQNWATSNDMEWYNFGGSSPRKAALDVGSNTRNQKMTSAQSHTAPTHHFMSHNRVFSEQIGSAGPANSDGSPVKKESREPGRYSCTQCDKTFNSKSGLAYHMEKHTGKFRLWCYKCQKGFTMKAQFESHMAKHEGRSFPCEYCPKRFQSKPSLRMHTQKCHSDAAPFQNLSQGKF